MGRGMFQGRNIPVFRESIPETRAPCFSSEPFEFFACPFKKCRSCRMSGRRERGRFSLPLFISSLVPRMMMARFFVF